MAMTYPYSYLSTMLASPLPEFIPNCKQYGLPSETLPFPDATFDLILQYGYMAEGAKINWSTRLGELYRVLTDNGVLELHEPLPYLYHHNSLATDTSYTDRLNSIFDAVSQHTLGTSTTHFNQHISTLVTQQKLGCLATNMQLAVPLAETGGCMGNLAYVHYSSKVWIAKQLALRLDIAEDGEFDQIVHGWQQDIHHKMPISLLYSVMVIERCKRKLSFGERLRLVLTGRPKEACPIRNRPCKLHKHH
jgi:SAM-dependent methyltransferase